MQRKKILIDARYAKTGKYRRDLQEAVKAKECPLCTLRWHTNPILKKTGGWQITETTQPYKNSDLHFLVISKKHKERLEDISKNDLNNIFSLMRWATKKFKIRGGGITLRFGDSRFTGATIFHLHFHLIVPKLNKRKSKALVVAFPIG